MGRVAVTGMSIVSPLGSTVQEAFTRLLTFKNCVSYWKELDRYKKLNTRLVSLVSGFIEPAEFDRKKKRSMGLVSLYAVASALWALRDAGLEDDPVIQSGETGVSYGSSSGSLDAIMDFYSMCVENEVKALNSGSYIKMMPQTTAVNISLYFKTNGRLIPSSTACTSGSLGIGLAYEIIKSGRQKIMIAGGAEEIHPTQIGVFDTLFATSCKNSTPELSPRPFDKDRDGLVIGEGAATLILEDYDHAKARGAKIYAEIIGFATNTDGTHITNPNMQTMARVMELSLEDANLSPDKIKYINAHGTGTLAGDIAESLATEKVFGTKTPVSTIKSYTGHTLGACGAIEALLSIEMMNRGWFCPNLNLDNVDEKCGKLDYIKYDGREFSADCIMSNNFAFGGINTSLIFKKV